MPKGRPKGTRNSPDDLQAFAKRIEKQVLKSGVMGEGSDSMERLICRLLTNPKIPGVAAIMAGKWVEWRFGKAKETHEHKVQVEMNIGDADRIIAGYFIAAAGGTHQVGEGDSGQTAQQDRHVLPA